MRVYEIYTFNILQDGRLVNSTGFSISKYIHTKFLVYKYIKKGFL